MAIKTRVFCDLCDKDTGILQEYTTGHTGDGEYHICRLCATILRRALEFGFFKENRAVHLE